MVECFTADPNTIRKPWVLILAVSILDFMTVTIHTLGTSTGYTQEANIETAYTKQIIDSNNTYLVC